VFLTRDGHVYTCGHGRGGRLGHGTEQACVVPCLVEGLQHEKVKAIAAAVDHTLFLTER
jgi:alpha-tubulin suppressor-like RCC1 family protein